MLKKVMFVSRPEAEKMPGWGDGAIISITEPDAGEAALMEGWHAVHRVVFHDTEPGKVNRITVAVVMTEAHAIDIARFVRTVAPDVNTIVVHCKGGISRSAAVAKWIAEAYNLPFDHRYSSFNKHVHRLLVNANQRILRMGNA
jgi:predicted protein tyrosine phosphatase